MASIIPGYEYDIFVSYRQKDNKGERWVSEFVEALKTELESTFKEDISVYFDINPHNGLLETHEVSASLEDKLKCLIFIPIISRTYCDPKSFAWQHEFKAFFERASVDQLGLKVRLPGGNVTSRVLPVIINDLDSDDIELYESILGGVPRGIEFIYKEPGVNKPLTTDDDDSRNLNKTKYRIQINKVANAIKEIIPGLQSKFVVPVKDSVESGELSEPIFIKEKQTENEKNFTSINHKFIFGVALVLVIIIALGIAITKIFKRDNLANLASSDGRISVAIMPFQNISNDTTWNIWQDGIQNNLITSLSNSDELKIRQSEYVSMLFKSNGITNYSSITPLLASKVSQKLDANIFVYGSINKAGNVIRLNAQLIDSKNDEIFKSFQIDGNAEHILSSIDTLSVQIRNFLIISALKESISLDLQPDLPTSSSEAFRCYLYGNKSFYNRDFKIAENWYLQAIAIDSNFTGAATQLSASYANQGMIEEAKLWILRLNKKKEMLPIQGRLWVNWLNASFFETPYDEFKPLRQLQELDDQQPAVYWLLGDNYSDLDQFDKAIPEFERALEIYKKWDLKPSWALNYTALGSAYHKTGQYKKEKKLYKRAEIDFPDDPAILQRQAVLALCEGDTICADHYTKKYVSKLKENAADEAEVANKIATIYWQALILDKAEEYCRKATYLQPENTGYVFHLAYFLIDSDRNIIEGLELIDKALKSRPDDFLLIDAKAWGFHKLGKNKEALELLEKSDSLKPGYDHLLSIHIEEVKKAIANNK